MIAHSLRQGSILLLLMFLVGCANLQTLNRHSRLPLASGAGRAVHLDAQQRLIVFTATGYCAEPSPDALAAYAAALGFGSSRLPGNTVAGSAAFNGLAGSIGLRTQSITLMRDTLYRTCEMMLNGKLSEAQISVLMARSQDLTVVIMAIESLTGAVVAAPVTLTPGGAASSTAAIVSNAENLSAARERQAAAKASFDAKKAALEQATTAHSEAKTALTAAEAKVTQTTPQDDPLRVALAAAIKRESEAAAAKAAAERDAAVAKQEVETWAETVAMLEKLKDSAMSGSTASVSGISYAGSVVYQPRLDSGTAEQISDTVEALVKELLDKSYFNETCLAVFTTNDFNNPRLAAEVTGLKEACLAYWKQRGVEAMQNSAK